MNCIICSKILSGKQQKYCSLFCKNSSINAAHKHYKTQRTKGESRKLDLIKLKGGSCEICGYSKNYSALCFHHIRDKVFQLDIRQCSNRSWATLITEAEKCKLLCHNCHMEIHHPNNTLVPPSGLEPETSEL